MGRFVEGVDRNQATLLPEYLDDFIADENPVRIVDAFVEEIELVSLSQVCLASGSYAQKSGRQGFGHCCCTDHRLIATMSNDTGTTPPKQGIPDAPRIDRQAL